MSKISFGIGKQKAVGVAARPAAVSGKVAPLQASKRTALGNESDNEDEAEPAHESVTGFSENGAILSRPQQVSRDIIIESAGNDDWRKRGRKNLLPVEVQAAQQNGGAVMMEKDEVSKVSGLQFATKSENSGPKRTSTTSPAPSAPPLGIPKALTADEEALQALLGDGADKPKSAAVIEHQENSAWRPHDETQDFRADVASRPDVSTLDEYAEMPVEDFGLALVRGMGKKRRANGEVIDLTPKEDDRNKRKKNEGFLGIGAKATPGSVTEIGAWGKADWRKNTKGEGFYSPIMRKNEVTGELISEEELEKKLKEGKSSKDDEDWRSRRDRNLEKSGRPHEQIGYTNGLDESDGAMVLASRSSSHRRDQDEDRSYSGSRRDRGDREYDSSRSRRDRDRSRDGGRHRRDDDGYDGRDRDRHRDSHRDERRHNSDSSHRSHRDPDRDYRRDDGGERRRRDR
jgi:hypothetical protein